jgi:hypothetical protein
VTFVDAAVSVVSTLSTGESYALFGAILFEDYAYETSSGSNAQAAVMFGNACYIWNGACATQVNLVELYLV